MGLVDKVIGEFRRMSHSEEDEDFEEFEPIESRSLERKERRSYTRENEREGAESREAREPRPSRRSNYENENSRVSRGGRGGRDGNSIVELQTRTLQQVVVMEPKEYEEVKNIADYLCSKFTIFLNLEQTDGDISTRILDFISGVAYANEGNVRRVAEKTYVVTPFTVTLIDSLMDGLENEGIFFKT